jgi:hypothetical protein
MAPAPSRRQAGVSGRIFPISRAATRRRWWERFRWDPFNSLTGMDDPSIYPALSNPTNSLFMGHRFFFRQWDLLYQIGLEDARAGTETINGIAILKLIVDYYR